MTGETEIEENYENEYGAEWDFFSNRNSQWLYGMGLQPL